MKIDGIKTSRGHQLDLTMFAPRVIGYQIEHKVTGRLLPTTTSFQVFGEVASVIRLIEVCEVYKIDSGDFTFNPLYESEVETGYVLIRHSLDFLKREV